MPKFMRICSGNTNVLVCVWHGWETVDKTETNVESCKTHRLGEELAVWVRLNEDAVGSEITEDLVNSLEIPLTFC